MNGWNGSFVNARMWLSGNIMCKKQLIILREFCYYFCSCFSYVWMIYGSSIYYFPLPFEFSKVSF